MRYRNVEIAIGRNDCVTLGLKNNGGNRLHNDRRTRDLVARFELFKLIYRDLLPASLEISLGSAGDDRFALGGDGVAGRWRRAKDDGSDSVVIDEDITAIKLKSKLSSVVLAEGFGIWQGRVCAIRRLLDHDGIIRSLITHVEVLFNHNLILCVALFLESYHTLVGQYCQLLLAVGSGRVGIGLILRVPIRIKIGGRFLLFDDSVAHRKAIGR
mmetsp:Transcript_14232/g.23748  ORF Transcript_14232/g.23748 Transcript_14232/m.23748 type:complete len:213 (-) Transcript_14232:85-723(-)